MGGNWKLNYNPKTDILWLHSPGELADGKELYEDVFAEYDEESNLIGLEIHIASENLPKVRNRVEKLVPELKGKLPDLKPIRGKKKAKV